jgi:CRP-like cAMP-binding protein
LRAISRAWRADIHQISLKENVRQEYDNVALPALHNSRQERRMATERISENLLLAALPREERKRLDPFFKPVELEVGKAITMPDQRIDYLYFPQNTVTSTVHQMSDGSTIETGLMGPEGLAGVQVWLGQNSTPASTFVQIPGKALQISTEDFLREIRGKNTPLNDLIAAYVHAFLVLTSMIAACNRLHSVDERLCRWLRMCYNRAARPEFPMRHEFIAMMLGVHRPTVSTTANMLQKAGLITYHYGNLTILNPAGLADGACECYSQMEGLFEKMFPAAWRDRIR